MAPAQERWSATTLRFRVCNIERFTSSPDARVPSFLTASPRKMLSRLARSTSRSSGKALFVKDPEKHTYREEADDNEGGDGAVERLDR